MKNKTTRFVMYYKKKRNKNWIFMGEILSKKGKPCKFDIDNTILNFPDRKECEFKLNREITTIKEEAYYDIDVFEVKI